MKKSLIIETDENEDIVGVELFHIINGEWVHIVQKYKNKDVEYFTDGVKEKPIENECTFA